MDRSNKLIAIILMIALITIMPAFVYADNNSAESEDFEYASEVEVHERSDSGEGELSFGQSIEEDVILPEADELMENYLYDNPSGTQNMSAKSLKGNRLTGRNLKYYNYFKTIIKNVGAARQSSSTKTIKVSTFLGKSSFTAKEMGVSKIGYRSGGKWHITSDALDKIKAMVTPEDWKKVYMSILCDLSGDAYWVSWNSKDNFYNWSVQYTFDANDITFKSSSSITFCLPVVPELAAQTNAGSLYIYKADINKLKGAISTRQKARDIVKAFDDSISTTFSGYDSQTIDYNRLRYYCDQIDMLVDYDHEAAENSTNNSISNYWRGPWDIINVFDGKENTKAVCAGYARALKYLCDISKFKSNWIECNVVTGSAAGSTVSNHMWNIVRMNDGRIYLIDPTWMDDGEQADYSRWFLRGAPGGTANTYTIEGDKRTYDSYTKKVFASAERTLASKDRYEWEPNKSIKLKSTSLRKLVPAKKAITVKWNKMSKPLASLYIDGYQIQYSVHKNFKGAKSVKVKGYAQTSKKISKLKEKKTYYIRIRTYAKVGRKTYYSSWSSKKKVKTK